MCNDHGRFTVPSVLLHRGLVILSQFVPDYIYADTSCYRSTALNPYAVLVAGQTL